MKMLVFENHGNREICHHFKIKVNISKTYFITKDLQNIMMLGGKLFKHRAIEMGTVFFSGGFFGGFKKKKPGW